MSKAIPINDLNKLLDSPDVIVQITEELYTTLLMLLDTPKRIKGATWSKNGMYYAHPYWLNEWIK